MTYLPNVLITGAQGQLGMALQHHPLAKQMNLHALNRQQLDITHFASIEHAINTIKPDVIINSAAYTAVDKAESEYELALQINAKGAQQLAQACEAHHIPFIHISTDYIFDGNKPLPYKEKDPAHPVNRYGESKWQGEQAVREACEKHLILRVSGVFSEYGQNFFKTMLRLAKERKELRIVADQITCPTYAGDIAETLYKLIQEPKWGTYHYCNQEATSWFHFASHIIETARQYQPLQVENIIPIPASEYVTPAKRPAYSVLDCEKIKQDAGITQKPWKAAVQSILSRNL